ncbi:cache domain-containing protein [Desulfosarcina cetonica]|uniref:cache domain-containing protein n=1 Tax=Desulfosarcina cetonica TaxID=90730 RepID=UPI0006D1213B|nr:cache domain-containing protein [Desulfosarcina cetonica]
MDQNVIQHHKDRLLKAIPLVSHYIDKFNAINKRWAGAITAGLIETGCMKTEAARLFEPLIQDMRATKIKYGDIQEQLVDAILFEMVKKVVFEITDAAKFAINILKRNLFERTADVGYLATDAEIVSFLKTVRQEESNNDISRRAEFVGTRLADYRYEYTVYNEIIILDRHGQVQVNIDPENRITASKDPLLGKTQAIDLHHDLSEDKYVETFRESDLCPGQGKVLVYSQKIEDPDRQAALGTLCLCFDFKDEMERIFKDLKQGNDQIVVAILDGQGNVMSSNRPEILSPAAKVPVDLNTDFRFLSFNGKNYLAATVATDGYQGFYGLTWYALAMIDLESAFKVDPETESLDATALSKLQHFSKDLSAIKAASEILLDDMKLDSINGQVKASKFQAKAFVEVLHFVKWIGEEIDDLFSAAIQNLQTTVVTSLFNDVQFRAFQGNNIADRNLYERANDVCWWALTPMFRELLTKHGDHGLSESERQALTNNLQYINDLYTPYLRLVLADTHGEVVATSLPPDELEERFVEPDMPSGQALVGMTLDPNLVREALGLTSSKAYCVSAFAPSILYGGRPTYIYSTAVRDPQNDKRTVGVIQIVFDAEPQFQAMLTDVLPKNEKKRFWKAVSLCLPTVPKPLLPAPMPTTP